MAIFWLFFAKMAEISRGRPLQGTDFILTLLDAELTTSTKEMNPKWKIEVIRRFWLSFGYFLEKWLIF